MSVGSSTNMKPRQGNDRDRERHNNAIIHDASMELDLTGNITFPHPSFPTGPTNTNRRGANNVNTQSQWSRTSFKIGKPKPSKVRYLSKSEIIGITLAGLLSILYALVIVACVYFGGPVVWKFIVDAADDFLNGNNAGNQTAQAHTSSLGSNQLFSTLAVHRFPVSDHHTDLDNQDSTVATASSKSVKRLVPTTPHLLSVVADLDETSFLSKYYNTNKPVIFTTKKIDTMTCTEDDNTQQCVTSGARLFSGQEIVDFLSPVASEKLHIPSVDGYTIYKKDSLKDYDSAASNNNPVGVDVLGEKVLEALWQDLFPYINEGESPTEGSLHVKAKTNSFYTSIRVNNSIIEKLSSAKSKKSEELAALLSLDKVHGLQTWTEVNRLFASASDNDQGKGETRLVIGFPTPTGLSSSPFHLHRASFNYQLTGTKRWILFQYNPSPLASSTASSGSNAASVNNAASVKKKTSGVPGSGSGAVGSMVQMKGFNPLQSLASILSQHHSDESNGYANTVNWNHGEYFEIIQKPGEIVYVPEGWYHATQTIADDASRSECSNTASVSMSYRQASTDIQHFYHYLEEIISHYYQKQDYKSSIRYCKLALGISRNFPVFFELLADSYAKIGSYNLAEEYYREAIQYNPLNPIVYGKLIHLLINHASRDISDAISEILENAQLLGIRNEVLMYAQHNF